MWSPDSVTDASTLLLVITRTEFVSALVITNECLQYLRGLTTSLQEEAKDIVQAVSEIKTLPSSHKQVRGNVDSYHSRWLQTVSKMCNEVETTPSVPRICGRQRHRASIPACNPYEYFRRTIIVTILDHLLSELTSDLVYIKNCFSRSILGTISVGGRRSCNCGQCGDGSEGAICCRPSKCVFSQWWDPQLVHQVEIWRERSWFKFTSFNSLLNIDHNLELLP